MNDFLKKIQSLVKNKKLFISMHGFDELSNDNIDIKDIISSIDKAIIINEYPDYKKGHCILVLQIDKNKKPLHIVWGIEKDTISPAVLITAYRPDPKLWENDYLTRRKNK